MDIQELQKRVHETAKSKGWHETDELEWPLLARLLPNWFRSMWFTPRPTARQKLAWLALVTDELDEAALEEDALYTGKAGKPEGVLIEMVDALIRIMDMAGACGWDMGDNNIENDYPFEYKLSECRSCLVSEIRVNGERQEQYLAELFLAVWALFIKARSDHSESEDGSPTFPDVEELILLKDSYNRGRSHRHGGKLA
jgi:hypothetical protein